MDDYDIGQAFAAIEEELINSMIWNMKRHRIEEVMEEKEWTMWQAEQLKALELYKKKNRKKYGEQFESINSQIDKVLREANKHGCMEQEKEILEAIKNGFKGYHRSGTTMQAEFFKLNERKLEALIKATKDDMKKAETAVLRMADDRYRKTIYYAQVYANTGAGTYEKAVDMATKDFLSAGMNCIEYANGARHTVKDYADMAIRTANKRAYLQGEGMKRQEWGIHTVIMNKRGNPCPKCLPFVGKVLIDDVWSGGSSKGGPYPLMSTAVDAGLYHPRCKDSHTTYFPGISTADDTWTKEELAAVERNAKREAKQQYAKRQAERFGRLARYSLDGENKKKYYAIAEKWGRKADKLNGDIDIQQAYNNFIENIRFGGNPSLHRDKMAMYAEFTDLVEDEKLLAAFAYIPQGDLIKYNSEFWDINSYNLDYVFAHEISHRMDVLEYHSWENERFLNAIDICRQKAYDNKKEIQSWFMAGGIYENSFALSDIISALTNGEMSGIVGHSKEYWSVPMYIALEIFANFSAADILDLPEMREFDGILKELFEAYKEIVN